MKFRFRHAATSSRAAVVALVALLVCAPGSVEAQTPQQIQQQIEALGLQNMTVDQIRDRLTELGYDASVIDNFFRSAQSGGQSGTTMQALRALLPQQDTTPGQSQASQDDGGDEDDQPARRSNLPDSTALEKEMNLRVFGLETFARRSGEFETMSVGAIPSGYVLGPGDEVVLILTGDVEQQLLLPVTREGFLIIPQAGQVWVNGLTMAELRDRLHTVLGRVYAGLGRGSDATIHMEASLGRVRNNQIFLTGQVRRPGTYTTSALASVLNALYQAGGPLPSGSFRDVRVLRSDQLVDRVDLYAFLTQGRSISNVILNPGDVIFLPPAGAQVGVKGEVTREALYEVLPGETLLDVIEFAGGLTAPAALGQARITRILPPWQRTEPGIDRTVIGVDLAAVVRGTVPAPELFDGDEIRIFRIRPEIRRVVTVAGAVWKNCAVNQRTRVPEPVQDPQPRADSVVVTGTDSATVEAQAPRKVAAPLAPPPPCTLQYTSGMRAWDAIVAAEGLRPEAYRQRAQIVRLNPADSTLSVIPFSLETTADGTPLDNPPLEEFDAIRVFSRANFQDSLRVRLSGEVRRPGAGSFEYRQGMTLEDLILQAGGLTPEADLVVEVSRRPSPADRREGHLGEMVRIPVDESYIVSEEGIRFYAGDSAIRAETRDGPNASTFLLRPHDQVFVRRVPNLPEGPRTVIVAGEVTYPGQYPLQSKDERLSQIIARAGGLTNTAFPGGFRLYRDGKLVNIELPTLLRDPGSENDLILLPGDSMIVPEYDPIVVVQGAVNSPAAVLYKEGADLDHYIANAGGYSRAADRDQVHVRFANGEGAVREKVLVFRRSPVPGPGSVINVPFEPANERRDLVDLLRDVAQVAGTLTTLVLVLTRL